MEIITLTGEDAQDSSSGGDLGLGLFGGWADLDALESKQSDNHGAEAEQQTDDHQGTTGLYMNCRDRKKSLIIIYTLIWGIYL